MWQIVVALCLLDGDIRTECHTAVIESSYATPEECSEALPLVQPRLAAGAQQWLSINQPHRRAWFQVRCEVPPAQA